MDGARDYRLDRLRAAGTWFSPIDPDNEAGFDRLWRRDAGRRSRRSARRWRCSAARSTGREPPGGMLRAHFQSLCGEALGPNDYLAIAARFDTLFLEAVPRLRPEDRSAARRLATLIDTLYEARARLVVLAAAEPAALYPAGRGRVRVRARRLAPGRDALGRLAGGGTRGRLALTPPGVRLKRAARSGWRGN